MSHIPIEGLSGENTSLWSHTSEHTNLPHYEGDHSFDVCVIGGGITGITCAYMLNQAGFSTCIIEKDRIAKGTTGHTTAKITSNHGMIYDFLIKQFGAEKARIYGEANQWAVGWMRTLAKEKNLDCDMVTTDAYTYAENDSQLKELEAEADAARTVGLPASFVVNVPLPFKTKGAVVFKDQARFHPRKYLLGLLPEIQKNNSRVFEHTMAVEVTDGDPCLVKTDRGTVKARYVIIATMYPFPRAGQFYTKLFPKQSYVLAATVNAPVPEGMFISADEYGTTIRKQQFKGGDILIFGGDIHKVGQGGDIIARYRALEKRLRAAFDVRSLEYYWDTQDAVSMDMVPYIGKLSIRCNNLYVATGFKQWGIAHSAVAASIIRDMITGKRNEWLNLYNSTRIKPKTAAKMFLGENLDAATHLIKGFLPRPPENMDQLANDNAAKAGKGGKTLVYKDAQGKLHCLNHACTHLGCSVNWNNADRSWNCPCHGSRFTYWGDVQYGPANKNLPGQDCPPEQK